MMTTVVVVVEDKQQQQWWWWWWDKMISSHGWAHTCIVAFPWRVEWTGVREERFFPWV